MLTKINEEEMVDWLNYLSCPSKTRTFLGFMKVNKNHDFWAVGFGDISVCGVHKYDECQPNPIADDRKETKEKALKYPHALFFRGGDNTSYIKRFETDKMLMDWFHNTQTFSVSGESNVYFYNS